ncbi:MAG: transcription termination factor NusA [Aphanocapsa feldmannii 277cV]|uniref:Transcription termination/antitermination protein NusA n=2 Tax=Aphanocapsa feldmannii TaxID=192050 RepID=A0A524RM15_9CHRO|nr:MAG: transcription termination factor NusA [Aphanocapsa feldmannii 288cV]TGG91195.1 MAG: transcription termination factor NusA [Aphanocapsa feldmannii 277cV]TGH27313.1 MAG: transcription termination factor NusA [Aphanocapsa feldmannii 277cI]
MALVMLPGLTALIDDISEDKKLPPTVVESALRESLLKGYEKYRRTLVLGTVDDPFDEDYFGNFDVALDLDEEGFRVLASKIIVEAVESEDHQIAIEEVRQVADDAQVGDTVVLDVTPEKDDFGRMAASQTKQTLAQKLREHQRRMIQEEFADLEDPVLTARVLRFERQSIILAVSSGLGRPEVEAELPRRDQLPNDNYRANATFKVFLKEVSEIPRRGPQLFVSRANAGLVVYLFENEVPEIQEGSVRIVAVAREANPPSRSVGPRTKVAVDSVEREVDPVGACIGARGSRIQQVVNELRGEKIDVIRFSTDPGQYIANSLSPARVEAVRLVDPEGQHAHVLVPPDQLSLAIGREGQNVRLAARLTGWKLDIKNAHDYDQVAEDGAVSTLIAQRRQEERLQAEIEARLEAEHAARAAEDARLRELYPIEEDFQSEEGVAIEGYQEALEEHQGVEPSPADTVADADAEAAAEAEAEKEVR